MYPSPDPGKEPAPPEEAGRQAHRPYRAWALQQDLGGQASSLDTPRLGDSADGDGAPAGGQAYLDRALTPGPQFDSRRRTGILLWFVALAASLLGAWSPIGLNLSSETLETVAAMEFVALLLAIAIYPRISERRFIYFEQFELLIAYAVISIQVAATGGSRSPFLIWTMIPVAYSAYFHTRRWVTFNCLVATALVFAPLIYTSGGAGGYEVVVAILLFAVVWTEAFTVQRRRELSRRATTAVKYLALGDPLTGVANLRSFFEFSSELVDSGERFALILGDMRGLRGANTVFGHDVGDAMLVDLARILCETADERSQVARVGGDEFAVLIPGALESAATAWVDRLHDATDEYNETVRGRSPRISVDTGIAIYPHDGDTVDAIRHVADRRMIEKKNKAISPVYEIAGTAPPPQPQSLLRVPVVEPGENVLREAGMNAGASWLLVSALMSLWLVLPGGAVPHPTATALLMVVAYCVAAIAFWGRTTEYSGVTRSVADVATLTLIAPGLWITGGWKSPLQLAGVLVVAFYAQFYRGRAALWRMLATIGVYSLAFWTSGPVSAAGQSLYIAIIIVEFTVGAILFANGRATDAAQEMIRMSATHDPLTHIPNLYAFRTDLERMIAEAASDDELGVKRPVLLIADVDDFHAVNMAGGHRGGDEVLMEVSQRLDRAAGDDHAVYRIGGDEFAVLTRVQRLAEATHLAERCRRALNFAPPAGSGVSRPVTCSVGYSMWHHEMSGEKLVESVETALAAIKGRKAVSVPGDTRMLL